MKALFHKILLVPSILSVVLATSCSLGVTPETISINYEQGEEEGQYNLGMCYDNGAGTPVDHKLAFEWFKKSSDQGYSLA
ncbi:hypothetical protein EZS27_034173, partial [termite gut metagenome]